MSNNTMNYQKINKLTRCFFYTNIHAIPFQIKKLNFLHLNKKTPTVNSLIKIFLGLELITYQRPIFIRAKKPFIINKIRKGMPLGATITLRKQALNSFLINLIWAVLPNIKNLKIMELKANKQVGASIILNLPMAMDFPALKNFYFFFHTYKNLKIGFTFPSFIQKHELLFHLRFLQIPV